MRSIFKQSLIAIILPTIFIVGFNSYIFAAKINPSIANIGFWYDDADIRGVIKNRLGTSVYIAPAVPNSPELIKDVANAAVNEARTGKPALIPVNLNGSHWTAIAIRAKATGELVVFYNDSFGSSFGGEGSESGQYIEAIRQIDPTAEILDLQVAQQNDGSSCGAFTAENLIALANIDQTTLTHAKARELLAKITDAKAIRILHLNSLTSIYNKIISKEEKELSKQLQENIETITEISFNEISNLNVITADRLGDLYLAEKNLLGLSAGDEIASYGVWIRGSIGKGIYKEKDSSKINHRLTDATIGFDSKIDDDTTVGLAVSYNQNSLKPKNPNINNNSSPSADNISKYSSSNIRSILGCIYGSMNNDESLVYRGNIEIGKITGKTNYQSIFTTNNSFKLKGELLGANLGVDYYQKLNLVILIPSIDISYESLKFSRNKQNNLNIKKTKSQKITITPSIGITRIFNFSQMSIIPELIASYGFTAHSKTSKPSISNNNGAIITSNKPTMSKSTLNIVGNITIAGDALELTLGYERIIQKKYKGQLGYAKLRVNF